MPLASPKVLVFAGLALLAAAIALVAFTRTGGGEFPWGIHLVTIPAVALAGLVIGWLMRDRQAAEDRARAEIEAQKKP